MSIVSLEGISKIFRNGATDNVALRNINLSISECDMIAVKGRSGSGKTTLLNLLGCIDFPDSGHYYFKNSVCRFRNQQEASKFRREHIGYITQNYALLDDLTAYENISVSLWPERISAKEEKRKIHSIMDDLEISLLKTQYPISLSGVEKQRVAIARAIIRDPDLILADEPTEALEAQTSKQIMEIFHKLHERGQTILIATHDDVIAEQCSRLVRLVDGVLYEGFISSDCI